MPRPTTKSALLTLAQENYQKLLDAIETLSPAQQTVSFDFNGRDQNIRDLLIHLYEWHQLLLSWEKANLAGKEQQFLRPGFTWKTYPQMNREFWSEHQKTSLTDAKKLLASSHQQVLDLIDSHTNAELFTKKHYSWTGTSSLGAYCISATSSHYDWALKELKKYLKTLKS